jgi:hypothetical protein
LSLACYAPALCGKCYRDLGGLRGVHGDACREGAERSNAEEAEKAVRYAAGDKEVVSASGDWHKDVPAGMVMVTFAAGRSRGAWAAQVVALMPKEAYSGDVAGGRRWLSEYPEARVIDRPSAAA